MVILITKLYEKLLHVTINNALLMQVLERAFRLLCLSMWIISEEKVSDFNFATVASLRLTEKMLHISNSTLHLHVKRLVRKLYNLYDIVRFRQI